MRKLLTPLVLVAFLICLAGTIVLTTQHPEVRNLLLAILAIPALFLVYLFPIFFWLAIALAFWSPVFLFLLLTSLFRRYKCWRARRAADQQLEQVYQPFVAPVAPPQEKPVPLMQRQFRH